MAASGHILGTANLPLAKFRCKFDAGGPGRGKLGSFLTIAGWKRRFGTRKRLQCTTGDRRPFTNSKTLDQWSKKSD